MTTVTADLALPQRLTLREASNTLVRLLAAIALREQGAAVCIRAQEMKVFDSSALAVLLECRRAAIACGHNFSVSGLPSALRGLAGLYGVEGLLTDSKASASPAG